MLRTKADLIATGCKSITTLVDRQATTGFDVFLGQGVECVFTMGACHVFAVALYRRLRAEGLDVLAFRVHDENDFTLHYVVGSPTGPYADVRLE